MPVLGADPDAPVKPFPEYTPQVVASRPVYNLTNHFAYHKNMRMAQRFNEQDRLIMLRFFSLALKKGYTEADLRNMVDVFWQTWGADHDAPAMIFTSTDMQAKLAEHITVHRNDPWLTWLNEGMPDTITLSAEFRKAVLLGGQGLELRYPDVVAECLRRDGDPEWVRAALAYVRDVVRWHLSELDSRPISMVELRLSLPEELVSTAYRHPSQIRKQYATVRQAIAAIPYRKKS